jgi:methionyl-tRNA formyltransferase
MGSPDFALPSLQTLVDSNRFRPLLVVTQPDREKGRGRKLQPTPVKSRALELGLPVLKMSKANYNEVVADISASDPDVIVVVAFGIIIKDDLLGLPELGCVNVHASLLPKYRGVSPIQAAILAGESETGCTTMHMDAGIDTGDILLQSIVKIGSGDTAGLLSDRLSASGAELLIRTLDGMKDGSVAPKPQGESPTSYTKKIKKEHGKIDWSQNATVVDRRIRAMTPWPSAYTSYRGKRLIVSEATICDAPPTEGAAPGSVVSVDPLVVACGVGALEIRRLKPEGKKNMPPSAFLAGHAVDTDEKLA